MLRQDVDSIAAPNLILLLQMLMLLFWRSRGISPRALHVLWKQSIFKAQIHVLGVGKKVLCNPGWPWVCSYLFFFFPTSISRVLGFPCLLSYAQLGLHLSWNSVGQVKEYYE